MSHFLTLLGSFWLGIVNLSVNLHSLMSPGYPASQSYSQGHCFRIYALVATMARMAIILGCSPPDQPVYCVAEVNRHALYSRKHSTTSNLVIPGSSVVGSDKRYQLFARDQRKASLFSFPPTYRQDESFNLFR